ncbi:MAG: pyrroline-5-carboxylate reductase [Sporolactobacillus sp.]
MNKIAFIGAGELAESLVKGFLSKRICAPECIWMTNHSNHLRLASLEKNYQIRTTTSKEEALEQADVVVLAFRPADTREALASVKEWLTPQQLIISLMVGVPSSFIESVTGKVLQIVRVMPNTSASIGLSATGLAAGRNVSKPSRDLACHLFEAVGTVTIVDEEEIDSIAGVAGSGPAYLYYLADAMQAAGMKEGLSGEAAAKLVRQTLLGAAQLLSVSGKPARELLEAVATPGGTTQAGIDALDRHHTRDAVADCVHQAITRAHEMSAPFSK